MAYRKTSIMDVWEIIRRWHDGQAIRDIVRSTGFDRKTVKTYKKLALSIGLSPEKPLPDQQEVLKLLQGCQHSRLGRKANVQALLLPHLDEIGGLINPSDKHLALKPKSAYVVLCGRYPELVGDVSYTSYKRFVHTHRLTLNPHLVTCRVEVEPGSEVQIDYALVGKLFDPAEGRMRLLYCFIGTLAHSRMKYVELTFRQNQMSFAGSHIRMYEFYGGVTRRTVIDNLKAGVIKADLYDPSLNRTYADLINYYGTFVDTARVRHPKDKGKVERDVQTVRETVRVKLVQNPSATLAELNRLMIEWSVNEYGQKEHGTTRERPFVAFTERERPALKALPARPFELAEWKQATVHPDHYLQFRGKAYSIPHAYVGRKVWIRASEHILKVFFNEEMIKQHLITRNYRHTDFEDFPDNVRAALDKSYTHKKLLERASEIGPQIHTLVHDLLEAHAYLNLRRAQGIVSAAEGALKKDPTAATVSLLERAAALLTKHGITATPENFRRVLLKLARESSTPNLLPLSEATSEFLRDITYFIK